MRKAASYVARASSNLPTLSKYIPFSRAALQDRGNRPVTKFNMDRASSVLPSWMHAITWSSRTLHRSDSESALDVLC